MLYLDLTEEYSNIMNSLGNQKDLQNIDNKIFDPISNAINKAKF